MTLYKQIAILVTFIFFVLLGTILMVSFKIIKDSAQQELYENAQNSVSSLSITISSTGMDQGSIETIINASFDNGNYEQISFVDMENNILYERSKEVQLVNIPEWFQEIVAFEVPVATANVSSGWQILGTLNILSDRAVTYLQLYKIMMSILTYLSIAYIISLAILAFVFREMLKPLFKIERQAKAVMQNEFVIQEKLPWTTEFKSVVLSINSMVRKFETIFKTASDTLSENKELLYNDNVMKIPNRRYFILKATEYLTDENGKNYGTTIIISMKKVEVLNQVLGYKNTDALLASFGTYLQKQVEHLANSIVCRVNGTEIVIMIPEVHMENVKDIVENILKYTDEKIKENELDKTEFGVNIGVCEYEPQHNMSELFSVLDYALAQAKLLPQGQYYELLNNKVAITKERWRQIILDGFKNDSFDIMYRKVIDTTTKEKRHNVVSFALKDGNNDSYFYGTLIAPVVELGMVQDVYMHVIKKVLISSDNQDSIPLSIQISSQFVQEHSTYEKLKKLFNETKGKISKKIIFEIPESVINEYFEDSKRFIKLFKEYGFEFGINSFIAYGESYEYLKELKPVFVKADERYILDAQQNINVVKIVLDSIGVEFIATGVGELEEVEQLSKKGVTVVSGAVVDKI